MRKIFFFVPLLLLYSCHKEIQELGPLQLGTYTGYFLRSAPFVRAYPIDITIIFNDNKFSGNRTSSNTSQICDGTYLLKDKKIIFYNSCKSPLDLESSGILSGSYKIEIDENKIFFTRSNSDQFTDTYSLIKQ